MTSPAAVAGRAWRRFSALNAGVPLRVRLVAAMLSMVTVALLVMGVAAGAALRSSLVGRVDDQLESTGVQVAQQALGQIRRDRVTAGQLPSSYYVRANDVDGSQIDTFASNYNDDDVPQLPAISWDEAQARAGKPFTVGAVHGDHSWRATVFLSTQPGISFTVAYSLDEVDATLSKLRLIELVVGLALLVLLGLVSFVIIRRSLRPLVGVERTALAIAGGDLSRRVPEIDPRTEVGRLGRAFNSMVAQIESAFRSQARSEAEARSSEERMRRFIGDASHELRTPLTSIRGFAELYRQGAVSEPADVDRVMGRIEGEATRMTGLVEDLLLLARLDQQRPLERAPVDLARLAEDAVLDAQAVAPDRPVRFERLGPEAPVVVGDEGKLRQVLANLTRNALVHTPAGTPVTVRAGRVVTAGGLPAAVVEVADQGPGIQEEDARRIFERFFRADSSRVRAEQGASGYGLGLSIVAAIVAAHGGTVGVDTAPGSGAVFRVLLPLHAAAAAPAAPQELEQRA
ncbi:two-component system OmpR family sensor kinase [Motilibacter peucedani]|uniref:histidine kinase n=1 Tax=Motilibacter peucedani TaxID=598650 RepID=A0A420XQ39_9ACTN|nr:HAMP domain-containing sensor histidine kinase [Motilibacter peucedani]RKS75380.1 two-component system OmpR family sensor kinase [Motilibacter peucedani]